MGEVGVTGVGGVPFDRQTLARWRLSHHIVATVFAFIYSLVAEVLCGTSSVDMYVCQCLLLHRGWRSLLLYPILF